MIECFTNFNDVHLSGIVQPSLQAHDGQIADKRSDRDARQVGPVRAQACEATRLARPNV